MSRKTILISMWVVVACCFSTRAFADETVLNRWDEVALNSIRATQSDQVEETGLGVMVGVFDMLAAYEHEAFRNRLQISQYARNPGGDDHATHVSGIVAAYAPSARIYSYDNDETMPLTVADVDLAVHSWGNNACVNTGRYTIADDPTLLQFEPNYDQYPDVPIIFAIGNEGTTCHQEKDGYGSILGGGPSGKNVIAVGATDGKGHVIPDSSKGPTLDGRIAPLFVAPGKDILSTCKDHTYCHKTGTSFAAPGFAGAAALAIEAYRASPQNDRDKRISSAVLRAIFANTTQDLVPYGPDYTSGFGRINTADAIDALDTTIEAIAEQGSENRYPLTVTTSEDGRLPIGTLRVTLAWDDVPSPKGKFGRLINDLDLKLIAPDGTNHFPLVLDPANPAEPATEQIDTVNTIEQIVVSNPMPGDWTMVVMGNGISEGDQLFAMTHTQYENSAFGVNTAPLAITLHHIEAQPHYLNILIIAMIVLLSMTHKFAPLTPSS